VDPNLINDLLVGAIASALTILIPKRTTIIRGSNAVINAEVQNYKNRKSQAYKKYKKSGSQEDFVWL
jgi:hypothetical protein